MGVPPAFGYSAKIPRLCFEVGLTEFLLFYPFRFETFCAGSSTCPAVPCLWCIRATFEKVGGVEDAKYNLRW